MAATETQTRDTRNEIHRRVEITRRAFLTYYNALNAACMYFEWPIETPQQELEAKRISLEAWEDPKNIMRFAAVRPPVFRHADYELASQWVDYLHCPMYCMEVNGSTAFFMCETHVFEVQSLGRRWEDLVPNTPSLVLATLLACNGVIVSDGDVSCDLATMKKSEVEALKAEFERRKADYVISAAPEFMTCAQALTQRHEQEGIEPALHAAYVTYIRKINKATSNTCFPFETALRARS